MIIITTIIDEVYITHDVIKVLNNRITFTDNRKEEVILYVKDILTIE